MRARNDRNVRAGMAKRHFWSVETPSMWGMHQSLSDVSSANLPYGRGDGGVCPGLLLKGHHNRHIAVFRTPRSPAGHIPLVVLLTNKVRES